MGIATGAHVADDVARIHLAALAEVAHMAADVQHSIVTAQIELFATDRPGLERNAPGRRGEDRGSKRGEQVVAIMPAGAAAPRRSPAIGEPSVFDRTHPAGASRDNEDLTYLNQVGVGDVVGARQLGDCGAVPGSDVSQPVAGPRGLSSGDRR